MTCLSVCPLVPAGPAFPAGLAAHAQDRVAAGVLL